MIELVVKLPEQAYEVIKRNDVGIHAHNLALLTKWIADGKVIPKGHGDLFDKNEILRFLKCPKYENCDWQNCFDCNESRCINLNNVDDLVPIIKADEEGK